MPSTAGCRKRQASGLGVSSGEWLDQSVARGNEVSAALSAFVDRSQVVELKAGADDRGIMRI